jgi:hypothetical protein
MGADCYIWCYASLIYADGNESAVQYKTGYTTIGASNGSLSMDYDLEALAGQRLSVTVGLSARRSQRFTTGQYDQDDE